MTKKQAAVQTSEQLPQKVAVEQTKQEKEKRMNPFAFIIIGLAAIGVAYFGLRRLMSKTETSNLNYIDDLIRNAVADAAASRLASSSSEVKRVLSGADTTSGLSHALRSELLECRVSFNPPENNMVLMTILVQWRDGHATKFEQKQPWEMLPDNVRASLIRTRRTYEYPWSLPSSN